MKITRHRYKVNQEYVAQNRKNLDEFTAALTSASVPGLSYRVFLEEDGQTFLHLVTSHRPSIVQEISIGIVGERTPPKTRSGAPVARGDKWRFVCV